MISYLLIFLFSYSIQANHAVPQAYVNVSTKFNEILETYDKRIRPTLNGEPTELKLQISVVALGPINEKDFTFRIDYFMRQWWRDDRLKLPGHLTLSGNPEDLIWLPDLYIRNSLQTTLHTGFIDTIRTTITNDGYLHVSSRTSAISSCNMDLHNYPMDKQTCKLIFESYAYNGKELDLKWHKTPIEFKMNEIQIEGYELLQISTTNSNITYITGEFFPILEIHIKVKRTVHYYLLRTYVPSSFLVMMTWGTFWLPATTYPARVGIIVTNFLASSFILQGASAMYTKVPYTTAIEKYLLVNITFILATMLEYMLVITIPNCGPFKKQEEDEKVEEVLPSSDPANKNGQNSSSGMTKQTKQSRVRAHLLDIICRITFPLSYALFLVGYFFIIHGTE